ncbi:MAG: SRPBCC family protein [Promethearchaeota archaeon]
MTETKGKLLKSKNKNISNIIAEPDKQEFFVIWELDAPRELVFKAYIEPDLLVQWLGPKDYSLIIETFESISGGKWRFINKDKEGNEYKFHGVNHEVLPPERIIRTFEYDGLPESGHVSLETALFEELPGNRTKLTMHSVFLSVADRDGMVQSMGQEDMNEMYERLDVLLKKLKSG